MKKPVSHVLVKRKLFIALLFLFIAFAGNAQWTFTATVKQTGGCIPYPLMGSIPYNTKSACEAARQYELSQSGSDWSFIGESCTTIITCTPCTGSDIGTPGQGSTSGQGSIPNLVNPGDVSINGILEGKPFFTPHQSQAFEDWASEYKQLLASYGITSILGKNFTIPRIPLTDDKYFNAAYTNLVINFNPKTAPVSSIRTAPVSNPPVNDPNVVDLRDKDGIVKLFTNKEEQKKRDEWIKESLNELQSELNQNYPDLTESELNDILDDVSDIIDYLLSLRNDTQSPIQNSNSELFTLNLSQSTAGGYSPGNPTTNSSPENVEQNKPPLTINETVDEYVKPIGLAQAPGDFALSKYIDNLKEVDKGGTYTKSGTITDIMKLKKLAEISGIVGSAFGGWGVGQDINAIVSDFDKNESYDKKATDVSRLVRDGALLVAGIAVVTSTAPIFGFSVAAYGTFALGTAIVIAAEDYYVDNYIYKK